MTSSDLTIENIFLILRMHARLIGVVFSLGVFLAVTLTYQTPKMYLATTTLNFEFNSSDPLDDRESGMLARNGYITTQVGILNSLNVAQHIVENLSDYEKQ